MKKTKFRFITVIIIFFIIFILFHILCQPTIAQDGAPTVNIALTEPSKTANVGPDDTGKVVFSGIVRVSINQATRVIVNLSAIDTWNSATVTPNSFIFTNSTEKSFTVTVFVPLETSFEGIGTVTVTGKWTSYPGGYTASVNPETGVNSRIDINQFFRFSITSNITLKAIAPGSESQFELVVNNEGNYFDTFTINITNQEELSTNGIFVNPAQTCVEIPEKGNESIIISIKTNKNIRHGDNLIQVKILSNTGITKGTPQQNITFDLKIKKNPKHEQDLPTINLSNLSNVLSKPFNILIIVLLVIVIGTLFTVYWVKKGNKEKN